MALKNIEEEEAKFEAYNKLPFTKICLEMKSHSAKQIEINRDSSSLLDTIKSGTYKSSNVGRSAWISLIDHNSQQVNCSKEGFNVDSAYVDARIGILGNNENHCSSPDTVIGFGIGGDVSGSKFNLRLCGYESSGISASYKIPMCYIYIQ